MRHKTIDPKLFIDNRKRLTAMMRPSSLAVVNANDLMPRNSDALSLIVPQTDLFYLTGIEQEETILLMCPNAFDEKLREVLFVRETSDLLAVWEGHKHSKEEAAEISGIKNVQLLADFPALRPGVSEYELEAEYAHEFLRHGGQFAYSPIIASGPNSCVLHYVKNDQECKAGGVLLIDVAASYANYNADVTRTLPVSGKFTKRQRKVYDAVRRVQRASIKGASVGKLHRDWQKEAQLMMNEELLSLGLLKRDDIKKQADDRPACWKYFPHGLGHSLGLDVHDYGWTQEPFKEGWVITVEPGIYIPKEGFGVRLENNIVIRKGGNEDLCANIPIEAEEVEDLMHAK